MNNIVIKTTVLLAFFLFQSFTSPQGEIEKILSKAFEHEEMEKVMPKNSAGQFLPITFVSNGLVEKGTSLNLQGHSIELITATENVRNLPKSRVLELNSIELTSRKATLYLSIGERKIKMRLLKNKGEWKLSSLKIRGEGMFSLYYDI